MKPGRGQQQRVLAQACGRIDRGERMVGLLDPGGAHEQFPGQIVVLQTGQHAGEIALQHLVIRQEGQSALVQPQGEAGGPVV